MILKRFIDLFRKSSKNGPISQVPSEPEILGTVQALIAGDNLDAALVEIETGLRLHPGAARLLALRGDIHLKRRNLTDAEEAFQQALLINAEQLESLYGLALVAERKADWAAAVAKWEACLALFPAHESATKWQVRRAEGLLLLSRYDEAARVFGELAAHAGKRPRLAGHVGLARTAKLRGDWSAAAEYWRSCLERFPKDGDAELWRMELAHALVESEHLAEAVLEYQAVLSKSPGHVEAREALARTVEKQGRFQDALDLFKACLAEFPEHPQVPRWQATMASLWLRLGDFDAAEAGFRQLAEQYPDNPMGSRGLAKVEQRRRRG